jgi:hypothetical protein
MKVVNARDVDVVVPLPLGGDALVEAGGELDTSDEHAKSLLAQLVNWHPVSLKAKKEVSE